jgi:hypothetical protein
MLFFGLTRDRYCEVMLSVSREMLLALDAKNEVRTLNMSHFIPASCVSIIYATDPVSVHVILIGCSHMTFDKRQERCAQEVAPVDLAEGQAHGLSFDIHERSCTTPRWL